MGLLTIVLVVMIIGFIFIKTSPQLGANPSESEKKEFAKSENFESGKFKNAIPTKLDMGFSDMMTLMGKYFKGIKGAAPDFEIPVLKTDSMKLNQIDSAKLIWFGHSAFFLKLDGKNILIDPMLGKVPAPHPTLGRNRYSKELPIEIEELPSIDLILISHDHYDHLDYGSIQKLTAKTAQFVVPLGVKAHLVKWGVAEERIKEFDWWQEWKYQGIDLAFTPSRHFSGRGLNNRFSTLWGSWVIQGLKDKIYFSGDGGYGNHFKEIGDKYGPFDLAMMECGQYNELWSEIHMMPEETAVAGQDVKAKVVMPIHWGAFSLALHSWTDPVERLVKSAEEIGLPLIVPKIGEEIRLSDHYKTIDSWWIQK